MNRGGQASGSSIEYARKRSNGSWRMPINSMSRKYAAEDKSNKRLFPPASSAILPILEKIRASKKTGTVNIAPTRRGAAPVVFKYTGKKVIAPLIARYRGRDARRKVSIFGSLRESRTALRS